MPQEGHTKQDCEQAAGKCWLSTHAAQVAPHGVPLLGDDLYSGQPFCALVLQHRAISSLRVNPTPRPNLMSALRFGRPLTRWPHVKSMTGMGASQK